VNRELSPARVRRVRDAALGAAILAATSVAILLPEASRMPGLALLAVGLVLGPGYTAPPLRLAWRGWGEFNGAFTHSIYMVLCGWVLQAGTPMAAFPWLVSVPIGLAIFVAHALTLLILLGRFSLQDGECRRIDALIGLSLGFVLWFCVYPLLRGL
jgi:1,4-dihydroxy-2-naphthoate octaprenyltransferase